MKWEQEDGKFHWFFAIIPIRTDFGEWIWLEPIYYKCCTGIMGENVYHWYSQENRKNLN